MNKFFQLINLHQGEEDRQKVLENVTSNVSFRGSNLWILACAIVIASIGLNVNSTAVIIGAMLISPLMGPIVGAGFGLGTFDFVLLRKSLRNLLIATFVSLSVATIYFFVTPFKQPQTELLARTAPNIYDVLIAFFGGLVGVIAITRVEKGNPIPGVAIATALMPPLCTAGFGLAIGNFKFFFGALYLYTINCVFICIATFLILKYLKYPIKQQVDEKRARQVRIAMSLLITVMLLPSIYFAFQLYKERKFDEKANVFVEQEFAQKGYTVLYKKTSYHSRPRKVELAFLSKKFTPQEIASAKNKLKYYGLAGTELRIRQDTTDLKRDILNELGVAQTRENEKEIVIANLQRQLDNATAENRSVLAEAKILFPDIGNLAIARHRFNEGTDSLRVVPVVLYETAKPMDEENKAKLSGWLKQKLNTPELDLLEKPIAKKAIAKKN